MSDSEFLPVWKKYPGVAGTMIKAFHSITAPGTGGYRHPWRHLPRQRKCAFRQRPIGRFLAVEYLDGMMRRLNYY
ncbi:MAG: hypothetical protein V2B19_24560 [Pseudomonadota bacterium]